jgi:membrane-associated protease RseP (regulator of RpoE activity)
LHTLLFVLTFLSTTYIGAGHYASFQADFGSTPVVVEWSTLAGGLWYSVSILLILGCHELGHYLACRYYNVDASLPFFIPMPIFMTGTMGAFIRIREQIPTKRMLFDIGIAGPIAGFLVAVPALFMGMAMSRVAKLPESFTGYELGEPLLFKATAWLLWGNPPDGYEINMHPMSFAAWFGLLATALNLFPVGQLDGGHITYTVFGRRSSNITLVAVGIALLLTVFSASWLVWSVLLVLMLFMFGADHPPTRDETEALDRTRLWLAVFAAVIFILSFTPAPARPIDFIRR